MIINFLNNIKKKFLLAVALFIIGLLFTIPAFAQSIKIDTFTRGADVALESHTSDSGGTWTGCNTTQFQVLAATDDAVLETTASNLVNYIACGSETITSADYWSEITGHTGTTSSAERIGPGVRFSSGNGYALILYGTGDVEIRRYTANSPTTISTNPVYYHIPDFSITTDYTLRIEITGTSIVGYVNGTQRLTSTDATYSAAGSTGFVAVSGNTTAQLGRIVSFSSGYIGGGGGGEANTYYIDLASAGCSDSNSGVSGSPWCTFSKANSTLVPGDTLKVQDGTYNQCILWNKDGTAGNVITIKAINDGKVIVTGNGSCRPLGMMGSSSNYIEYVTWQGIVFRDSQNNYPVVEAEYLKHVTLQRISIYDTNTTDNNRNSLSAFSYSENVLLEDIAIMGTGRKCISQRGATGSSETWRRIWCWFLNYNDDPTQPGLLPDYMSPGHTAGDTTVENAIMFRDPNSSTHILGLDYLTELNKTPTNNQKLYGSVVLENDPSNTLPTVNVQSVINYMHGNTFQDVVIINPTNTAFQNRGDADMTMNRVTIINPSATNLLMAADNSYGTEDPLYDVNTTIKNSLFYRTSSGGTGFLFGAQPNNGQTITLTNSYNDLYNIATNYSGGASAGTGEITNESPTLTYNTAYWGNGAYLIPFDNSTGGGNKNTGDLSTLGESGGQIGAAVLYEYVDGVLTTTPLWPWPMEARIRAETYSIFASCKSATYSSVVDPTYGTCTGGLWTTLTGLYPGTGNVSDTVSLSETLTRTVFNLAADTLFGSENLGISEALSSVSTYNPSETITFGENLGLRKSQNKGFKGIYKPNNGNNKRGGR